MLDDQRQIDAVRQAMEPGIRDPSRPRLHFENIFSDFYSSSQLAGKRLVDLGPGHFDFCEIVKRSGAQPEAIELDPAVIELGRLKGIPTHPGDLSKRELFAPLVGRYDGVFCRGSINACWFIGDEAAHVAYLDALLGIAQPDGIFWISPCNEAADANDSRFARCVEVQIDYFVRAGFSVIKCDGYGTNRYGIWSSGPALIYTKNLEAPPSATWSRVKFTVSRSLPGRALARLRRMIGT